MSAAYLMAPHIHVEQRCMKAAWPSRQTAFRKARDANASRGPVQMGSGAWSAYRCKVCRGWHIGHRGVQ